MNVLIVEDEKLAAERLSKLVTREDESLSVVAIVDTVSKAIDYLKNNPEPDLILLDIELGDGKSFDIFEKVDVQSHIIFITAFDEYALKAFKYNSIDYLLKPLKKKDFTAALEKFKQYHAAKANRNNISPVIRDLHHKNFKTRFLVRQASRLVSVPVTEVAYAYTRERYHYIKTTGNLDFPIDNNLDELEEQLDPARFFRVNRQFVISYEAIDQVFSWFDSKVKLTVKPEAYEDIIISRLKANEFKKWLSQ